VAVVKIVGKSFVVVSFATTALLASGAHATSVALKAVDGPIGVVANPPGDVSSSSSEREAPGEIDEPGYEERYWQVDPRQEVTLTLDESIALHLSGQYRIDYSQKSELPLSTYKIATYRPSLGQSYLLEHRLRITPRVSVRRWLTVISQFDLPHGMVMGRGTHDVEQDPEPFDTARPFRFTGRWFYAIVDAGRGRLMIGQLPVRWGVGLIAGDGDQPQTFGELRGGTIVDRIGYVGRPLGRKSPFELQLATDLVASDRAIRLSKGDLAARGTLAVSYVMDSWRRTGVMIRAEHWQPALPRFQGSGVTLRERTLTFDWTGRAYLPISGKKTYIFAESEAAAQVGVTDFNQRVGADGTALSSRVRRTALVARIGAVQTEGQGQHRFGRLGADIEWGWASNDADPTDDTDSRFVTHPNRRVGLILFDQVLRWKTARAATALQDPSWARRPSAIGVGLPTEGGIAGATYVCSTFLVRPHQDLDLRAGFLVADAVGDWVDPAGVTLLGRYGNFDGGNPTWRDLGVEFDGSVEYRHLWSETIATSVGIEAGAALPGRAFADQSGNKLPTQALARGRFGIYF